MNRTVQTADIAESTVEIRTVFIQKDTRKDNVVRDYRPVTYLNLVWKLLTKITAENFYDHLQSWP